MGTSGSGLSALREYETMSYRYTQSSLPMKVVKVNIVNSQFFKRPRARFLGMLGAAINRFISVFDVAKLCCQKNLVALSRSLEPIEVIKIRCRDMTPKKFTISRLAPQNRRMHRLYPNSCIHFRRVNQETIQISI